MNLPTQPDEEATRPRANFKQWLKGDRRVWPTATSVAGCVVLLRMFGLLQSAELSALDQLSCLRPAEAIDNRIVIVGIDEQDLRQIQEWPLPDQRMAELLQKLASYQPRAIGLDIYRDFSVGAGQSELEQVFETTSNLVGIEKIEDENSFAVAPPAALSNRNQIGFNNVVVDDDGRIRRSLLYWTVDGQTHTSFALKLALVYLQSENVEPKPANVNPKYLQLGQAVFHQFQPSDGGYIRMRNSGGYQVLVNFYNAPSGFEMISLSDVMTGNVPPDLLRDRIVLIGSTAVSLKDFFYTSNSSGLGKEIRQMSGVELHANFIHQILGAALEGRSLLRVWPDPLELGWILVWSWVGASVVWELRSPRKSALSVLVVSASLTGICYLALLQGWWIPLVPAAMALVGSAVAVTGYIAHLQEELKKSKEFLQSVINTIPDPIFVKDNHHRWIVLNEAYCRLIGQPLQALLERSDSDFFSEKQAIAFRQQDELTFATGTAQESEEEFTDAHGITHLIATKRSLHRDAAGNQFLVGIIRDITQRKKVEEELRRTAAELVRSNAELMQAETHLRQMAYHDPLTGLPNRKLLQDRLQEALVWASDHGQLAALLFLDLDGFKAINDTLGHQVGDLLLKAVAQRLTGCLRGSDLVARLGGDEFVVLLPAIPGVQDVARVAEKILETLAKKFVLEEQSILITTSLGISIYPLDGTDMDDLMVKADRAMYSAKELGKNRYEFFAPEPPS
ncbi:CHASE2 domain-containing protein [Leptolyngbya sp. FACHB-671]|uniref:CHASE2 domain-containing protein n=1 Tax=Leptolyngbya sp. FACHB-671 TaxID=2692812 RepID=UPI001F54923B|nr:CHASE2 domain-containing protein [Leptolyngbya sp. FACHB-671]